MTNSASDATTTGQVEIARSVLKTEIEGLQALSDALGADFDRAITILEASAGRVIVSGIGKSGHVGSKIAATLASTGKPSHFVHAAEASHGDLGMIQAEDVVLALSKSGETAELRDLVAFTRRFGIPLIGITSAADSALARASTVALVLPDAPEACPNGLAPTTSTTMMMAMGDALAVTLLKRRNFSARDFKQFHPGGRLGAQLMHLRDLMHKGEALPLITAETSMTDALVTMSAKRFGCVGVTDGQGLLTGIITDGDLRRHLSPDLLTQPAASIMTANPKTAEPDMLAAEAVNIMNDMKITTLFVVEDGKPLGIVHIHDMLRAGTV